jgi:hypothetical protein
VVQIKKGKWRNYENCNSHVRVYGGAGYDGAECSPHPGPDNLNDGIAKD